MATTRSPFSACVVAMWRSTRNRKSSGVTTTIRQIAVLELEVLGGAVHAVHFPVHAVEVEVAHPPVGERLVHLELDLCIDEPLAHLAFWPARAPHPVGCDRAVAITRSRVVRLAHLTEGTGHLSGAPLGIVAPEPLHPLVHGGGARACHVRMQFVHPAHVCRLVLVRTSRLVGPHPDRREPVPFLALGAAGEPPHAFPPCLTLHLADHRRRDQLRGPDVHVSHRHVAIGGQEAMLGRGAHLPTTFAAQLVDELAARLDDPLHLVRPDLPVGPHRHDLRHLKARRRRQAHPRPIRQDHPGLGRQALVKL